MGEMEGIRSGSPLAPSFGRSRRLDKKDPVSSPHFWKGQLETHSGAIGGEMRGR